jgi:CheY-like chemotaxis protein
VRRGAGACTRLRPGRAGTNPVYDRGTVSVLGERTTIGSRGSVLIVNDQPALRDAMVKMLQARGFRTHAADSGRKALEFARSDRPDVILIDMDPPAVDGWESARRLKADPLTRSILVVAMSEDAETDRRNLAMRVGCDAFAVKPFDVDHLIESVERLLPS